VILLFALGASLPIIDGTYDPGDPAVVGLAATTHDAPYCTGTLVSRHVIVTAGHCAGGAAQVYFGSDPVKGGTWLPVASAMAHPMFDPVQLMNDIAIVVLGADPPASAIPVPLGDPSAAPVLGTPVRFVGFGYTGIGPGGMYGAKYELTAAAATCATMADPMVSFCYGIATCNGDSGGPAFVVDGGREVLEGVTSWGDLTCAQFGVDTRVDAYRAWLDPLIDARDPATCDRDGRCATGCAEPDLDCPCAADGHCTITCAIPGADPDCPATCAVDGTCAHDCPFHDPDCPIVPVGGACTDDFACGDLGACDGVCRAPCDPSAPTCPDGTSCETDENARSACLPAHTHGCTCVTGGTNSPHGWILPGVVIGFLARKRARRRDLLRSP
jgi:hypothetical protein